MPPEPRPVVKARLEDASGADITLANPLPVTSEVGVDSGTATGGSGTTLEDTAKSWQVDIWEDAILEVDIGGIQYTREIDSNILDALDFATHPLPGAVVVAAGCPYRIKTVAGLTVAISSGNVTVISGQLIAKVSGETVIAKVSGETVIGKISGEVVKVSGEVVQVSGQAVKVSGATVIGKISGETVVTTISGNVIGISGQTVIAKVSGEVVHISGQAVKVSGQIVYVSGQPVKVSGQTVVAEVSGQIVYVSGQPVVTSISGNVVKVSGEKVLVITASGDYVSVSGQVIAKVSGEVVQVSGQAVKVSGQIVYVSGQPVKVSGQTVVAEVSGQIVYVSGQPVKISGEVMQITPPTAILTGLIRSITGGTAGSGGEVLGSGAVKAVQIKAITQSGAIVIGSSGNRPWYEDRCSGLGFVLENGEVKSFDIDNLDKVYVVAQTSGDQICWLGVN